MFCPNCGQEQVNSPKFCQNCGYKQIQEPVLQPEAVISVESAAPAEAAIPLPVLPVKYVGFWRRFAAFLIDYFLINIVVFIISIIIGTIVYSSSLGSYPRTDFSAADTIFNLSVILVNLGISWLYHVLMESSSGQATLGKMALGIIVTDSQGRRISFGRATGRYFAKFISWLILGVGHLMIAFTGKKQGLHDIMAGTLVVRK